jgi:hypothetical protein
VAQDAASDEHDLRTKREDTNQISSVKPKRKKKRKRKRKTPTHPVDGSPSQFRPEARQPLAQALVGSFQVLVHGLARQLL